MRELKTTQKMRYEKFILGIVLVVLAVAAWLIIIKQREKCARNGRFFGRRCGLEYATQI
jgi:hypothetical protein